MVITADLSIATLRADLGLPYGVGLHDSMGAPDPLWRACALVNLAMRGAWWMNELLRTISMSVATFGVRGSSPGRFHGSDFFALEGVGGV